MADRKLPTPDLKEKIWQICSLQLPSDQAELVSLICWETDSLGSEERRVGDHILASFYFPQQVSLDQLEIDIRRICGESGFHPARIERSSLEAPTDFWTANFREHFQGVLVGKFFIRPPWIARSPKGIDIQIDPSHAFGTGTHESTQLILENLPGFISGMHQLLDVGTGSGILALAAGRLSPELLRLGIDNDPDTIPVAARNAALNRIELPLLQAGPETVTGQFDLVLANLTRPLLKRLAPELTRLARCRLVTSGFTAQEAHLVEECILARRGWKLVQKLEKEGWMCLCFEANVSPVGLEGDPG